MSSMTLALLVLVPLCRLVAATLSVSLDTNSSLALLEHTLLLGEWVHALACRHRVGTSTRLCCVISCGTGTGRSTTCVVGWSIWHCDTTDTSTVFAVCWACATSHGLLHFLDREDLSVRHDSPLLHSCLQRLDS